MRLLRRDAGLSSREGAMWPRGMLLLQRAGKDGELTRTMSTLREAARCELSAM